MCKQCMSGIQTCTKMAESNGQKRSLMERIGLKCFTEDNTTLKMISIKLRSENEKDMNKREKTALSKQKIKSGKRNDYKIPKESKKGLKNQMDDKKVLDKVEPPAKTKSKSKEKTTSIDQSELCNKLEKFARIEKELKRKGSEQINETRKSADKSLSVENLGNKKVKDSSPDHKVQNDKFSEENAEVNKEIPVAVGNEHNPDEKERQENNSATNDKDCKNQSSDSEFEETNVQTIRRNPEADMEKKQKSKDNSTVVRIEDINLEKHAPTPGVVQCTCCSSGEIIRIRNVQKGTSSEEEERQKSSPEARRKRLLKHANSTHFSGNQNASAIHRIDREPEPVDCLCVECVYPGGCSSINSEKGLKAESRKTKQRHIRPNDDNTASKVVQKTISKPTEGVSKEQHNQHLPQSTGNKIEKTVKNQKHGSVECVCFDNCFPFGKKKTAPLDDSYQHGASLNSSPTDKNGDANVEPSRYVLFDGTIVYPSNRQNHEIHRKWGIKSSSGKKKKFEYDIPIEYLDDNHTDFIPKDSGNGQRIHKNLKSDPKDIENNELHNKGFTSKGSRRKRKEGKYEKGVVDSGEDKPKTVLFTNKPKNYGGVDQQNTSNHVTSNYSKTLTVTYASDDENNFQKPSKIIPFNPFGDANTMINGVFHRASGEPNRGSRREKKRMKDSDVYVLSSNSVEVLENTDSQFRNTFPVAKRDQRYQTSFSTVLRKQSNSKKLNKSFSEKNSKKSSLKTEQAEIVKTKDSSQSKRIVSNIWVMKTPDSKPHFFKEVDNNQTNNHKDSEHFEKLLSRRFESTEEESDKIILKLLQSQINVTTCSTDNKTGEHENASKQPKSLKAQTDTKLKSIEIDKRQLKKILRELSLRILKEENTSRAHSSNTPKRNKKIPNDKKVKFEQRYQSAENLSPKPTHRKTTKTETGVLDLKDIGVDMKPPHHDIRSSILSLFQDDITSVVRDSTDRNGEYEKYERRQFGKEPENYRPSTERPFLVKKSKFTSPYAVRQPRRFKRTW